MSDTEVEQSMEGVAQAAEGVEAAASATTSGQGTKRQVGRTLEFILDVSLQVTVEVGRTRMTIQDLLQLGQGSVVELDKLAGEPLDIDKFGVRLTDIVSPEDRVEGLEE